MKLIDLMNKVSEGYPGTLAGFYDPITGQPNMALMKTVPAPRDSVAWLVVREVAETFVEDDSDEEQLKEAAITLDNAMIDIGGVICHLRGDPQEDELTDEQIERQDRVDNVIHLLLIDLGAHSEIPWNIELIGIVRDAVQEVVCNRLKLMTEMEFYPYVETPTDETEREELDRLRKVDTYLRNDALQCPYCRSSGITVRGFTGGIGSPLERRQAVLCLSCGKDWEDVYTLTGVDLG